MAFHPLDDPRELPVTAYSALALPPPVTMALEQHVRADVLVIGGGITGLSAALHLAASGADVLVLEANELGWGASGRSFGQVVPYLRHEPWAAASLLGEARADRLIQAAAAAADLVFELISRYGLEQTGWRSGLIFAATTPKALHSLRRRAAYWQTHQVSLPILDAVQVAGMIGGGGYPGALLEARGGVVNSLGYTRGLAQAARGLGARLHTRSEVAAVTRDGAGWRADTAGGSVSAAQILVCTNAYDRLFPALARHLLPLRVHALMSSPLPPQMRSTILPGGQAVTDSSRLPSGIRLHADGRLHVSNVGPLFGRHRTTGLAGATRRVGAMFPQLGHITWEAGWSGWVAMSRDQIPHTLSLDRGVLAGFGYSGRGIALGTMMGRDLARRALGALPDELDLPADAPPPIGFPHWLARLGVRGLAVRARLQDRLDRRHDHLAPPILISKGTR